MGIVDRILSKFITVVDINLFINELGKETGINRRVLERAIDVEASKKGVEITLVVAKNGNYLEPTRAIKYPLIKEVHGLANGASFLHLEEVYEAGCSIFINIEQLKLIDNNVNIPEDSIYYVNKGNFNPMEQKLLTDPYGIIGNPCTENLSQSETNTTEKDPMIAQLQSENAELQTRIAELEDLMSSNVEQQPPVDSKPTLQGTKYNTIERETHLLIIGALANLLANPNKNKTRYVKGAGAINQSALNSDIGAEIASLLQPETKSRSEETIKQRVREALNLITKAE